jgi:hypothetical protein
VGEGVQDLVALPLVERLLLADPDHRPGVRTVRAAAQRHLVDDGGAVHQPADGAHVGPGQRGVVEDRAVLLPAVDERLDQLGAADAQGFGGGVQVEPVAGLVLHLGEQDGLALQRRGAADPVALGLHADDLGVRVLGDLADQRPAVRVGHGVARLDLLVGGDHLVERGVGEPRGGGPAQVGLGRLDLVQQRLLHPSSVTAVSPEGKGV